MISIVLQSTTTWKSKHPNWANNNFLVWTSIPSVSVSTPIIDNGLKRERLFSTLITV